MSYRPNIAENFKALTTGRFSDHAFWYFGESFNLMEKYFIIN